MVPKLSKKKQEKFFASDVGICSIIYYVYFSIGFLPKQKFSILNFFHVVSK